MSEPVIRWELSKRHAALVIAAVRYCERHENNTRLANEFLDLYTELANQMPEPFVLTPPER